MLVLGNNQLTYISYDLNSDCQTVDYGLLLGWGLRFEQHTFECTRGAGLI